MKKTLILFLIVLAIGLSLCSCSNTSKPKESKEIQAPKPTVTNPIIKAVTFEHLAENTQKPLKELIEARRPQMDDVINDLKKKPIGAVGCRSLFSAENKLFILDTTYLLGFGIDGEKKGFYSAINLSDLHANYIQGDTYTNFLFDNKGNYVITYNTMPLV